MTKKATERLHAKRRAFERYGLTFTKDIRNHFCKCIRDGKGKFTERQSRRVTIWNVEYEGMAYRVVYDSVRHEIVSFLPAGE